MSSARADDTASHATENGKLYSTRFLTVAERFSVAVAQTKNDGVVEGKLPTPDRYSNSRLKREPTSKTNRDSSVGLQPEASAMIVFSVRNSRVTVMAEWLQTEHIPTGFKEETTEEPRRQIPTKSGNIGFAPGERMSCVRIVPKVSDHSLKRMHDGASHV